MITPAYSSTAPARILPAMSLDFTAASLDSRVTFSRAGNTATVVNISGTIVTVNANIPRFDYDPITHVCRGLLVEKTAQNLYLYSQDVGNVAAWINVNSIPTASAILAPDGSTNGAKISEAAVNSVHNTIQDAVTSGTVPNTWTIFAKAAERSAFWMVCQDNAAGNGGQAKFDLAAGTVPASGAFGLGSGFSADITNFGGGWYRCRVTVNCGSGVAIRLTAALDNGSGTSYLGDPTKGIYFWGAQLEVGSVATSFIPTVATSVTRNADVATVTGTNFSGWYSVGEGSFSVSAIQKTVSGLSPIIQADDTTANNLISLRGNAADPELYIVNGGGVQTQIDAGTIAANTAYKLAGAWATNNCAAAKDGAAPGTDAVATIPTPTQLRIGSDGTNYANAWIANVLYWKQRIINAETQAFSK